MKHKCHVCNKDYDCGKNCVGSEDEPCIECVEKMDVTTDTIECLPKEARNAISETIREVQFRLSAVWRDGFTKHDVFFDTEVPDSFSVKILLRKEYEKK